MANAMFAETLDIFQHSTPLIPGKPKLFDAFLVSPPLFKEMVVATGSLKNVLYSGFGLRVIIR
jgi:hypothetical protein